MSLSLSYRATHACLARLMLIGCLLCSNPFAQSQTITANFASRSGSTPAIPAGLFSVGGAGDDVTEPAPLSTLTTAGLDRTRFWISLDHVYANSTPNFHNLDSELEIMQTAGFHPLAVLYGTPSSLAATPCDPPSDIWQWGTMAASIVAHVDQKFPGLLQDYEIWNEPELPTSLCISDATTRLNTYVSMFAEAAEQMHDQAEADGQTIRTGGPAISQLSLGPTWFPALLNNASAAPYVDFVSFHLYLTGQTNIDDGMDWSYLYTRTQSAAHGVAYDYEFLETLVRQGQQPNAASTPIYISEFNDNWAFAVDCCRNDPTYAPLWNSLVIADLLNVVYEGAGAVPGQLSYFSSAGAYFCMLGQWNETMNCDPSATDPYPQYYAYKLFASPDYLDLQAGGYMAASVSPSTTTSGLDATAFYTGSADDIAIINPSSTSYSSVTVDFADTGFSSSTGVVYLLNKDNGQIYTKSVDLDVTSNGYSAKVDVPAYSTVAISIAGSSSAPKAALYATQTAALEVSADTSQSTGGGSPIVGRTIWFGDGTWTSWEPTVNHTYAAPGTYSVVVVITNQSGQESSAGSLITVSGSGG